MNPAERAALQASLAAAIYTPKVPTVLAPMREVEEPELEAEPAEPAPAAEEEADDEACRRCGDTESTGTNAILLCDGCDAAYHMLCLPRPLATIPDGEWKCPICNPAFSKALEGTMERSVGSRLWAQDKKGLWGKARVLGVRPARPAGGDTGGSEPSASSQPANEAPPSSAAAAGGAAGEDAGSPEQVKVSFYGYSAKFDEWISVGDGKLRPLELGPPIVEEYANEYYVMGDVLDMRQRNGRKEYLTSWEGFALPTWEPKSAFVGDGAKRKLEVFLEALRARKQQEEQQERALARQKLWREREAEYQAEAGTGEAAAPLAARRGLPPHAGQSGGAKRDKASFPCEPTPNVTMLPKVAALPESRSWVHLACNHPVADRPLTFVPYLGDDEGGQERAREVERHMLASPSQRGGVGGGNGVGGGGNGGGGAEGSEGDGEESGEESGGEEDEEDERDGVNFGSTQASGAARRSTQAWAAPTVQQLPSDRTHLSALFCRRCFTYECTLHPAAQPLPRWRYAPTLYPAREGDSSAAATARASAGAGGRGDDPHDDNGSVFAPLAEFLSAANGAPPLASADGADSSAADKPPDKPLWASARCTCKLAPTHAMLYGVTAGESCVGRAGGTGDAAVAGVASAPAATSAAAASRTASQVSGGAGGGSALARGRHGAGLTALHLRRKIKAHKEQYGTGCSHDGPCDTSNPDCLCISKVREPSTDPSPTQGVPWRRERLLLAILICHLPAPALGI